MEMKPTLPEQRDQFMDANKVAVLIGHKIVQLNGIDSSCVDLKTRDVTVTGPKIAVRDDIDIIAFRKAVLDLYANFPSNR